MTPNVKAFLDMLAWSEGTSTVVGSDNGYNVLVGGKLFVGYEDHPRIMVFLPRLNISSTAAGRYQLLARYFDAYKASLHLPDFSPDSQDAIAIQQITERKALGLIESGDFSAAVDRVSNIWASLPGNSYQQYQHTMSALTAAYVSAGGLLA